MIMKKILLTLPLMALMLAAQAAPNIHIGTMHDYLDSDQSTLVKRIRNAGDSTAFVRVSIYELLPDAAGNMQEQVPAPVAYADVQLRAALLASPDRLIIPAKGMQAARLMYVGPRDAERYFRVRFEPVAPAEKNGFTAEHAAEYGRSLAAGVTMLTGYGAILFVAPQQVRYDTAVTQQDDRVSVKNNGNATVVINHFQRCSVSDEQCSAPVKHHVLPGGQREFVTQPGQLYRFTLQEGKSSKQLEFSS